MGPKKYTRFLISTSNEDRHSQSIIPIIGRAKDSVFIIMGFTKYVIMGYDCDDADNFNILIHPFLNGSNTAGKPIPRFYDGDIFEDDLNLVFNKIMALLES